MKVMVILGSRNSQGQTARAAEAMTEGMRKGGCEVEVVYLPEHRLERCRQCDEDGWGLCRSEGRCTIEDDFGPLVEKLRQADAAVFATPVYWSDLSESMKALLDRLRRIDIHDAGREGIAGTPAVGICVAGGGGGGAPACTDTLVRTLGTCGFNVVDVVPVRRQNLRMKLSLLETTGQWLAAGAPEV